MGYSKHRWSNDAAVGGLHPAALGWLNEMEDGIFDAQAGPYDWIILPGSTAYAINSSGSAQLSDSSGDSAALLHQLMQNQLATAAGNAAGTVLLAPGTHNWLSFARVPSVQPGTTPDPRSLVIRGCGQSTRILLTKHATQIGGGFPIHSFLVADRVLAGDYVIVSGLEVSDLLIDVNNITGAVGHLIFGNYTAWTASTQRRMNFENIALRRIKVINATEAVNHSTFYIGVYIALNQVNLASDPTLNWAHNIRLEDIELGTENDGLGGNQGFTIAGTYASSTDPAGALMYLDEIHIERCKHWRSSYGIATDNCFFVGSYASVGKLRMRDCVGRGANDTVYELNNILDGIVDGCVAIDGVQGNFMPKNFREIRWFSSKTDNTGTNVTGASHLTLRNCTVRYTGTSGQPQQPSFFLNNGGVAQGSAGPALGQIELLGCKYEGVSQTKFTSGNGEFLNTLGAGLPVRSLIVEDCEYYANIASTDTGNLSPSILNAYLFGVNSYLRVSNFRALLTGSVSASGNYADDANHAGCYLMSIALGSGEFVIDGVEYDYSGLTNASSFNLFRLGPISGSSMKWEIKNVNVRVGSDTNAKGVGVLGTTRLAIAGPASFHDCDLSGLKNYASVLFQPAFLTGGSSNLLEVDHWRNYVPGGITSIAPAGVTPGASVWTHQNTTGFTCRYLIQGGTVSLIKVSRDNVTFYDAGVVAGIFVLKDGEYMQVTYTVAPTVTRLPI